MTIIAKILEKMHRDAVKHTPYSHPTPPEPSPLTGLTQHRPGLDAYGQKRVNDIPKSILSQNYPEV